MSCDHSMWYVVRPLDVVCRATTRCGISCDHSMWYVVRPLDVVCRATTRCGMSCDHSMWYVVRPLDVVCRATTRCVIRDCSPCSARGRPKRTVVAGVGLRP